MSTQSTYAVTIDDLERWVVSGGTWRVVDISNTRAVVDLCTCTREPMERVEADDPAVVHYLRMAHSELDFGA